MASGSQAKFEGWIMNEYLYALCACLILALVVVIRKRKTIVATVKAIAPRKYFGYELTENERRIVRRLLENGEEEAAIGVISSYFNGDIDPHECRTILDYFRT
jgi:hypothetical protein